MDKQIPPTLSALTVKPLEWCGIDGPRTSAFSRSASEEALARMGWKAAQGRPKPPECREILRPNLALLEPTPSVMLHSNECDCSSRPSPNRQQNLVDEALALDIFSTSEAHRAKEKSGGCVQVQRAKGTKPKDLRRRPSSIASFARLFSSTAPTPPISATAKSAELCRAASDFDSTLLGQLLFEDRTPINHPNPSDGITPLLAAINSPKATSYPSAHLAVITLLLDRGADPNAVVSSTNLLVSPTTPLITACMLNMPEVVRILLTRGAAADSPLPSSAPKLGFRSRGMTALHAAVSGNHPDCVSMLLTHGGANPGTPFDYVQPTGPWSNPTQPNNEAGRSSRRSSISSTSASSVRSGLLLRVPMSKRPLGAKVGSAVSIRKGKTCDDASPSPIKGVTALHLASGSHASTGLLLRHAAPANIRDSQGRTPLHWAVEAGDSDIASLLLDAGGADVDPFDQEDITPLGLAVAKAESSNGTLQGQRAAEAEMMRVLLQSGASLDVRCGTHTTTLRRRLRAIDVKDRWSRAFGPLLDEF